MTNNHADSHDRDKLSRWSEDLANGTSGEFPVYAVFLVTSEDRYAHDVFREFRSSFEKLEARFEHLMIFGQHGVSRTVLSFLDHLGHSLQSLPMVALFSGPLADGFHSLPLTGGTNYEHSEGVAGESGRGSDDLWRGLLVRLEGAAGGNVSILDLESVPGITSSPLAKAPMEKLVREVLRRVSPA